MNKNHVFRQGSVKLTQHQASSSLQRRGVPETTQKMPSENSSADITMPGIPKGVQVSGNRSLRMCQGTNSFGKTPTG